MAFTRIFLLAALASLLLPLTTGAARGAGSINSHMAVSHSHVAQRQPCTLFRMTVASGDSAYSMLRDAGVNADGVMRWLGLHGNADALSQLRPGDALVACATPQLGGGWQLNALIVAHHGQVSALSSPGQRSRREIARVAFKVGDSVAKSLHAHHVSWRLTEALQTYLAADHTLPAKLPADARLVATFYGAPSDRHDHLLCIDVTLNGTHHRIFHYVDGSGHQYLLGDHAHGIRILAMLPPVRHARISSGWGWRINPVLKRREFHKGIDFAAPLGTPIRAALGGTVKMAAWHGNYGRMLELRDAHGIMTRYGHLHRFAHGIHPGTHVHVGQVIGYVGSTGLSTGPHVYFELWKHHRRVNPLITHPVVDAHLASDQRSRFRAFASRLSSRAPLG